MKVGHTLVKAVALVAVIVLLASAGGPGRVQAQGPRPPTPVEIVAPQPIPVSGSLGISGTANVTVTNTSTSPAVVRDAENGARSPFQAVFCVTGSFGGGTGPSCLGAPSSVHVPADQRLVIEYAAAECSVSNVNGLQVALATTVSSVSAAYPVHLSFSALSAYALDAGQQVRIYADPDTTVGMNFQVSSSGADPGYATCRLLISGHTVKL